MNLHFLKGKAEIDQYWPDICPLFQSVVDRGANGEFTTDDIYISALEGVTIIGASFDDDDEPTMAVAFAFKHYPQKIGVNVYALGGKNIFEFMGNFLEKFKEFCIEAGADWIEASCSPAMTRINKRLGFQPMYTAQRLYLDKKDK